MTTPTELTPKQLRDRRYRFNKRIRDGNEAFAAMTPQQKRVVIAKDVIDSIGTKKITATCGRYLETQLSFDTTDLKWAEYEIKRYKFHNLDAKEQLLKGTVSCSVCAIGALFTCAVQRMDELTVGEFVDTRRRGMVNYLAGFFDAEQLDYIECAFERSVGGMKSSNYNTETMWAAHRFGNDCAYRWSTKLGLTQSEYNMTCIMENIMANDGVFVP